MLANRPKTRDLVDGGNPNETLRIKSLLGFVDGQTTNPSLIAKNPEIQQLVASGHTLSPEEEKNEYKKIVRSISPLVGDAAVSIEVFADLNTTAEEMLAHGQYHVLAASIRSINHLLCSFFLDAELATVPSKVLQEWAAAGFPMPDHNFKYKPVDAKGKPLKPIAYKELDLNLPRESFDLAHELTTKGIQKFVADYQSTLRRSA